MRPSYIVFVVCVAVFSSESWKSVWRTPTSWHLYLSSRYKKLNSQHRFADQIIEKCKIRSSIDGLSQFYVTLTKLLDAKLPTTQ